MRALAVFLVLMPILLPIATGCGQRGSDNLGPEDSGFASSDRGFMDAGTSDAGVDTPDAESSPKDAGFAPLSQNWCDRVLGGPPSTEEIVFALSAAHARVRFFGMATRTATVDRALSLALAGPNALTRPALDVYAARLIDVCSVPAEPALAPTPASVTVSGRRAIVRPGTGPVVVPLDVHEIVLDLTEVRERADIEAALTAILDQPLDRGSERTRRQNGLTDEVFAPAEGTTNVYSNEVVTTDLPLLTASRAQTDKIVVLTGPRLSPAAAEPAGALRLARRAFIVGEDVFVRGAESRFDPVGDRGLVWRYRELLTPSGERWPDRIYADGRGDEALNQAFSSDAVPPANVDPAARAVLEAQPLATPPAAQPSLDLGVERAAMITAHGAADLFFGFFDEVGRDIDGRLLEVLAGLEAAPVGDRRQTQHALARLSNALHDAHSFTEDHFPPTQPAAGVFPVWLERHGDEAWVRQSSVPAIHPGDAIQSIDGRPLGDLYREGRDTISYATQENGDLQVGYSISTIDHAISVHVVDPAGNGRDITVQPAHSWGSVTFLDTERRSGFLGDLGAPQVYYVQMNGPQTRPAELLASVRMAMTATAVVIDMRGYPWDFAHQYTNDEISDQFTAYGLLFGTTAHSALFKTPIWTGPDGLVWAPDQLTMGAPGEGVHAPIAVIVGPGTQSSAEDFVIYLRDAHPGMPVVGRPSSGTDGNITGLQLPGGFAMTFTGLNVRFPDGSRFHGVGHVPTALVQHRKEDFAAGIDRDLIEALRVF